MPSRKFGHNSPYDEHGMPLGVETVDYDNADEVRRNQVHEKYVEEIPFNDPEYQPRQMPKNFTGQRPLTRKGFNSALVEGVGFPDPNVEVVDIEDPAARRELLVREADDKGFTGTPELPKVESEETVHEIGANDELNPEMESHQEDLSRDEDETREARDENVEEIDTKFLDGFEEKDKDNDGVQE